VPAPRSSVLALCAALVLAPGSVRAGEAASADLTWRACLGRAFQARAALGGRELAAEAALRACRSEETTYLAALASSPLLDDEDIVRARPALAERARARLLDGPRAVLR
jgi:hypothetical protein